MKQLLDLDSIIMQTTIPPFHEWLVTKGFREETRRGYKMDINQFHKFLSKYTNGPVFINEIGVEQMDAFVHYLTNDKKVKASTVNRKINSTSTYFNFLKKKKWVKENPFEDYERLKVVRSERMFLQKVDIEKIIKAVKHPIIHYFVMTMAYTGIRVKECINLTLNDVNLDEGYIQVINGKGGKNRTVPINQHLIKELKKYLENHRPETDSLFFFAIKRTGTVSTQYVNRLLKEACEEAGIEKHVTSHILRHSFASYLVKNDTHVAVIQRLLGHSDVRTTSVYMHVQQDDLKDAINRIDF